MGLSSGKANRNLQSYEELDLNERLATLSVREKSVFSLMLGLRSTAEIALQLGMNRVGVKHHMTNIYRKLAIKHCDEGSLSKRLVFNRTFLDCQLAEWVKL